jgi:hypothetical protein
MATDVLVSNDAQDGGSEPPPLQATTPDVRVAVTRMSKRIRIVMVS